MPSAECREPRQAGAEPHIRLLVFDFGGVVCRFDYRIFCDRLASRCGREADAILAAAFGNPLQAAFESGQVTGAEYHRAVMGALKAEVPYADFRELYGDIFTEIPETVALLRGLHGRYPLYLLSDTNAIHFDHVRARIPALALFSECILSYRVGAMKPQPRIFQEALRRSGLPAEHCLFIDDRLPNVEGAARLGMRAVQYESPAQLRSALRGLGIEPAGTPA
ncbi:MAG: HAD family hydrolase [Candidatus Methylomirabilales bacterium]